MKQLILSLLAFVFFTNGCQKQGKEKRIAILTPTSHPSLEQIEKGFIETMKEKGSYQFKTYNAQGSQILLRSEIKEIISKEYDLIFTIGTLVSTMVKEIFTKENLDTPIVFTCINDPVGMGIVETETSSGNMMTGVKELLDFEEELSILQKYKKDLSSLLLVYNPREPGLEKNRKEIEEICTQKGLRLEIVQVFHANELQIKLSPFLSKVDGMMVLKDNTVVSGLDVLVKLANRHKIPLLASDLDSPDKGAALGYGVYEIDFGIEGAKKALLILEEGKTPSEIPVTPISHFALRINKEAAQKQGLSLGRHP
ncbi:MAG: ABC transporter substrate-binding protein [Chlamydiia bacterium]|nr:ABC transporter substrate-binding protein [Chlamydiia bacterium]